MPTFGVLRNLLRHTDDAGLSRHYVRALIQGLDTSPVARMARATEQGYIPLYHGTPGPAFERFDGRPGTTTFIGIPVKTQRYAIFGTPDRSFAEGFASQHRHQGVRGSVRPMMMRQSAPLRLYPDQPPLWRDVNRMAEAGADREFMEHYIGGPKTWENFDDERGEFFTNTMRKAGYDGAIFKEIDPDTGLEHETYAALNRNQIRWPHAMFNPRKINSSDPLAAVPLGVLAALAAREREV